MTNSEARKRAQAAASQVQGAAEVGADVEALAQIVHEAECVAYNHEGRNARCEREARAIIAAGWVPPERVAEARAEGWDEAYSTGVADEFTSMEYDGGRTPPARVNPYRIAERGDS